MLNCRVVGALERVLSMAASWTRKGVIGSATVFPFSWTFTNATVFRDGARVRLVRPMPLANLYAEDSAVQVFTAGAVHFCF